MKVEDLAVIAINKIVYRGEQKAKQKQGPIKSTKIHFPCPMNVYENLY